MSPGVSFPPLGSWTQIAEGYLRALGLDVVSPPKTTRRTLDLGVAHCPESVCVPCKLLFGNYLEAAERGADTIIMLGGPGTCRLGYSVARHGAQLATMGFECRVHTLDLLNLPRDMLRLTRELTFERPLHQLIEPVRLLISLMRLVEQVETTALALRPRELHRGSVDRALATTLGRIGAIQDGSQLQSERDEILDHMGMVPYDAGRPVLRLGLVGDIYTILTPFLNLGLERELGRLGVEARRWFTLRIRVARPVLPASLRRDRKSRAARAGRRYLARDVGGFAKSTIGEAALMAQGEVDGLVHVAPFNCTPEIVAQSALVSMKRQQGVPVLNLSFDEQTARAGLITRLEAFTDMLWTRKRRLGG
jgi:predicted nucleotide-binding protein (sugar kinase/HSP70/actin superfamily)